MAVLSSPSSVELPFVGHEVLDPDLVQAARREEMRQMEEFEVFERIPIERGYTGKVLTCRWVDRAKGESVRARLVARDFADSVRYGTYAATPSASELGSSSS